MELIPQEELEEGEGEAINAMKRWYSYVDSLANRGKMDKVNEMDDLKSRIEGWRMDMAEQFRMAPASVLEEHLLLSIAYTTANLKNNQKMDKDTLIAAGVRSNGIDELEAVLNDWTSEASQNNEENIVGGDTTPMTFKSGEVFCPANSWRYSVYKPRKKTGKATWEVSYDRFMNGDSPQMIAITQASGKPVQVSTVVGHILDALTQGRPLDLGRLASAEGPRPRVNGTIWFVVQTKLSLISPKIQPLAA